MLGKDVLNVAVDFVREDVVCGRCGHKGHFHSTCFKPLSGSVESGKGGRGKGPGHGVEFPPHAPAPYNHLNPAQFGHFGPRPPPCLVDIRIANPVHPL